MAASRQGQRCGCYGFLCDALVHGQARTEMERNRAQAPRRRTYPTSAVLASRETPGLALEK
jgi:hypothetical protein